MERGNEVQRKRDKNREKCRGGEKESAEKKAGNDVKKNYFFVRFEVEVSYTGAKAQNLA